jgi:ATP-dependent phosphofructokinase / diphosphate-dependent phosphofructokinase
MARIGLLTGGGDCPGLNALICAAVSRLEETGQHPVLLRDGFLSLVKAAAGEDVEYPVSALDRMRFPRAGGTVIGSSRTRLKNDMLDAAEAGVQRLRLDGLIAVGGDGSLKSAHRLAHVLPVAAVPKTIDNDVHATEFSLGFQTAVQTAVDAIERIQDTASSHGSAFLVEVMGRRSGFLAAAAAEACAIAGVIVPEQPWTLEALREVLRPGAVVVVGEGAWQEEVGKPENERQLSGIVERLLRILDGGLNVPLRGAVLGHTLRGGPPCAADRLLAASFARHAVDTVVEKRSALVVHRNSRTTTVDIEEASSGRRFLSEKDLSELNTVVIGR